MFEEADRVRRLLARTVGLAGLSYGEIKRRIKAKERGLDVAPVLVARSPFDFTTSRDNRAGANPSRGRPILR
jgi:hypothetical protein